MVQLALVFYHDAEVGNQGQSQICVILKTVEGSKASTSTWSILLLPLVSEIIDECWVIWFKFFVKLHLEII